MSRHIFLYLLSYMMGRILYLLFKLLYTYTQKIPFDFLLLIFYHEWVLSFFKDFFSICGDNLLFIPFGLLIWHVVSMDFLALNQACIIPGINPTWTWYITFLM